MTPRRRSKKKANKAPEPLTALCTNRCSGITLPERQTRLLLRADLSGTAATTGLRSSSQHIVDMTTDFELRPEHLVRLCDAVLSGELEPDDLEAIGFCLIASDHFVWDGDVPPGDVVAETVHDWSAPEVNYRLTHDTVRKFRERLLTGKDVF